MTITVTADVAFAPPRNEVELSVPVGNVMTSVSLWRNDSSGRSLVRSQPSAGFESRTVFDYECPYGQTVTYDWAASYYDPALVSVTFSEPWSVFPGPWAGDTARGSIAANRLTMTPIGVAQTIINRLSLSLNWDLITVAYLSGGEGGTSGSTVSFVYSGGSSLRLFESGGNVWIRTSASPIATSVPAGASFTVTRQATSVLIAGSGVSYLHSETLGAQIVGVSIGAAAGSGVPITVGALTAAEIVAGPGDAIAETSAAVNLNPADAWLIAPQAPALSVPLSNSNQQAAGIRELNPVNNASNTTIHRILGTSTPVTTTTGNRQADTLGATIYTHTSDERVALRALLAPDTPILINVPASWELDLAYGFYQVGDTTESRPYTLGGIPMRDFNFPLTRVRSPDVDVENPGWSYAQVATTWAAYTEVLANYTTYADLAVDERI